MLKEASGKPQDRRKDHLHLLVSPWEGNLVSQEDKPRAGRPWPMPAVGVGGLCSPVEPGVDSTRSELGQKNIIKMCRHLSS